LVLGKACKQRRPQRLRHSVQAPRDPQVLDQMAHEHRVAAGAPHQLGRHIGVHAERGRGCRGIERPEHELLRGASKAQLDDELVSFGASRDDKHPRRVAAAHERREEIAGRGVRPLEVLDEEDHGASRGESLQRLDDLPQHPLAGRAPGGLVGGAGREPRDVGEPARCASGDRGGDLGIVRHPAEPVQQREVCLARTPLLHAVAADDEGMSRRREERLRQRALADPGFAGHEHEPAAARHGRLERSAQGLQLARAPGRRTRDGGCGRGHALVEP
jgi:hypothetical protein